MGKLKQVLLIQPPLFILDCPMEREESRGHHCPVCNSSGQVSAERDDQENIYKTCPFCKGSGRVKAVITTEWTPDKK